MSPKTVDLVHEQDQPNVTLDMIDNACLQEITRSLREYVASYYTPSWHPLDDIVAILTECSQAFADFILYTFDRDDPEINVEVYLTHPLRLSHQLRSDLCFAINRELSNSIDPNYPIHEILVDYTHTLALSHEEYFTSYISMISRADAQRLEMVEPDPIEFEM